MKNVGIDSDVDVILESDYPSISPSASPNSEMTPEEIVDFAAEVIETFRDSFDDNDVWIMVLQIVITAFKESLADVYGEDVLLDDTPSDTPSTIASNVPSTILSDVPSTIVSDVPSNIESDVPSDETSSLPSSFLSEVPSDAPTDFNSIIPTTVDSINVLDGDIHCSIIHTINFRF